MVLNGSGKKSLLNMQRPRKVTGSQYFPLTLLLVVCYKEVAGMRQQRAKNYN